jgi:hypothetical protein
MKVNEDGKIVVMYYYTTQQHFAQHIGVTIVNPEDLDNPQTGIGNQEKISGSGGIFLQQNYPNPFTSSSSIGFEITENHPDRTRLKIYDISGKEIMTLVDEQLPPGAYSMEINAADIPGGVYFFRLTHGMTNMTKKMIIVK